MEADLLMMLDLHTLNSQHYVDILTDETCVLPVSFVPNVTKTRAPSEDRTHDPWFTRPVLYPLSYGGYRL